MACSSPWLVILPMSTSRRTLACQDSTRDWLEAWLETGTVEELQTMLSKTLLARAELWPKFHDEELERLRLLRSHRRLRADDLSTQPRAPTEPPACSATATGGGAKGGRGFLRLCLSLT